LLEVFNLILTQNDEMAQAMVTLNAPADRVARGINLKSLSAPLPIDHDLLYEARAALGHRPVWVASSTHAGEEKTVLAAHQALRADHPDLHLILAPRHPERGDAIAQMISEAGLTMTRRSQGDAPGGAVFLADSMGELGCWYALSDLVFLGGSLHPIGGHNPFEVAQAGALVLSGPHVTNFAETYAEMTARGAAFFTGDAEALTAQLAQFLNAPEDRAKAKAAAADFAQSRSAALGTLADRLIRALELARDD
jgi:3-deoxy-D-manno-octulosonic-acid transferase